MTISDRQTSRLRERALKQRQRLETLSARKSWNLPRPGRVRPLPGPRRVILPLEGSARARALQVVERVSVGLQGADQAHLRADALLRRLSRSSASNLAAVWEPCVRAARRKSHLKTKPFDCLIGESAACAYCQLEAQLRLASWMASEPRLLAEPRVAVTISRLKWRRPAGMLRFDLEAAKKQVRDVLNQCAGRVSVFGRIEFSILVPNEAARIWEPHLHLTIAGPDAFKVKEALLVEFREVGNRPVVGVDIYTPMGWASYINKGVGTRRLPFVNNLTSRPNVRTAELTKGEDLELGRYQFDRTIYDLTFRWGIDLPRHMMDTLGSGADPKAGETLSGAAAA